MKRWMIVTAVLLLLCSGCSKNEQNRRDGDEVMQTYTSISQAEAREMMQKNDGHVIVDVRRQDEFAQGHLPGASVFPMSPLTAKRPPRCPTPIKWF